MKLNWGHKLIIVFILFGSMMLYLVYRCVKTNYDLVSKDYYKDELVYQQVIDGAKKANLLSSKVSIDQSDKLIRIHFPKEMESQRVTGEIWFYCESDAARDRKIPLNINANGIQQVSNQAIVPGNYIARFSWDCNGQHYYSEETVTIR